MSDKTKVLLISALNTFLATFVGTVAISLSQGGIEWTGAFWLAIAISAVRAEIKAVTEQFVPIKLGGKK